MKSFKDIIKVPKAVDKSNNFDLSCDSILTQDFFVPKAIYSKEIVPNEHLDIKLESFVRLSPLLYPTFMRCTNKVRAFFVPFSSVWRGWNNFITGTPTPDNNFLSTVPCYLNSDLVDLITDSESNRYVVVVTSSNQYDICAYLDGDYRYYTFTQRGRRLIEILTSLGYRICWDSRNGAFLSNLSLLPLLCYYKAFVDWYLMSQYVSINYADRLKNDISYIGQVSETQLEVLFERLTSSYANYSPDYFTSAFSNPVGPGNNLQSYISASDNTGLVTANGSPQVQSLGNNTPFVTAPNSSNSSVFTQYTLDLLKSLTDYMRRHQLVGSQAADRFMSRFGVKIENNDNPKSIYLGSDEINIQIGDVLSTSVDPENPLGTMAGKGVAYGNNGHFTLDSSEFGMVIIFSDIVPHVGYVQGVKRHTMHREPTDFFTPEFEVGNQAIAMKEISLPRDCSNEANWCYQTDGNNIFGYIPRYAEYKVGHDFLNGNYIFESSNLGEDAWIGSRLFRDGRSGRGELRHDYDQTAGPMILGAYDSQQYNRIFADEDINGSADEHFRTIYHLAVNSRLPMSPLFDNYEFANNGRELTMKLGGSTLLD